MPTASQSWDERLRSHGFRITPQRQLVLEAVDRLGHGSPEEILAEVQRHAAGVNLSTVYRTLEVLEEVGLVTHAHIGHGAPTYHSVSDEVHIHLVCHRCQVVDSIPAEAAQSLVDSLAVDRGFVTDVSHMTIQGTCRACREAPSSTRR
ncbi:MAG: Fur family transcriptional regulator [Candidatus Nanopelagicales bacterium]